MMTAATGLTRRGLLMRGGVLGLSAFTPSVIMAAGVTLDTPAIFAALILISALGLAIYGLVVAAERWLTPWETRTETAMA